MSRRPGCDRPDRGRPCRPRRRPANSRKPRRCGDARATATNRASDSNRRMKAGWLANSGLTILIATSLSDRGLIPPVDGGKCTSPDPLSKLVPADGVTEAAVEFDRSPGDVQWWKVGGKAVRYQLVDRLGSAQPSEPMLAQALDLGTGIAGDRLLSVVRQDDLSTVGWRSGDGTRGSSAVQTGRRHVAPPRRCRSPSGPGTREGTSRWR